MDREMDRLLCRDNINRQLETTFTFRQEGPIDSVLDPAAPMADAFWLWNSTLLETSCRVDDLLHPNHVRGLQFYFDWLDTRGRFVYKEEPAYRIKRKVINSDPLSMYLLRQYLPFVSQYLKQDLVPSYSILCRYTEGSCLDVHTDVAGCDVNVTVQVGRRFSQHDPRVHHWPLCIMGTGPDPVAKDEVNLRDGDAVIYYGTRNPHWRPMMPPGMSGFDVMILHYFLA